MKTLLTIGFALCAALANAAEVTRVGIWELHSSFWMSLHQTLIHDAMETAPRDMSQLPKEQQDAWTAAVGAYRAAGGDGDMTFDADMYIAQDILAQVADDATEPSLTGTLAAALTQAAPVYRAHWWLDDDAANRFFIGYASAMLRDAGDELARAHAALYHETLPKSFRLDVTPFAGPYGAYTHRLQSAGWVTTMSCRDPGYQGVHVLEMVLHETSHSIVSPRNGSVARAIAAAAKNLNIEPPRNLWHAILFATSGELARRALVRRGITNYEPVANELFTRAWPKYRQPIEKYWYAYLSGEGTLDEAIAKIVADVK